MSGKMTKTDSVKREIITKEEIAGLPVHVRRTANGGIMAIKAVVELHETEKDLYSVHKVYKPTAQGYYKLNRVAGIKLITPKTLFFDGLEHNNPYIEEFEGGAVKCVHLRKIGLGRDSTGNLSAIDQTISFSPMKYLVRDIMKIDKKGVVKTIVKQEDFKPDPTKWYIPVGMGLMVEADINHEDFQEKLCDYTNDLLFAERKAASILERNILKKHPAIGVDTVIPDRLIDVPAKIWNNKAKRYEDKTFKRAIAKVTLVVWREADIDFDKLGTVAEQISAGERPTDVEVTPEYIQADDLETDEMHDASSFEDVEDATEQPETVEVKSEQATGQGGNTGSSTEPTQEPPQESAPELAPKIKKLIETINNMKPFVTKVDPDKFQKIINKHAPGKPLEQLDEATLKKVLTEMQKAVSL